MDVTPELLHSLGDGLKIAYYDVKAGDKYRIIALYKEKFYAIFWIQVSRDGSIYCGIYQPKANRYLSGRIQPSDQPKILSRDDGLLTDDKNIAKLSFHGSGKIHSSALKSLTVRAPIISLVEQEELLTAFFEEPSNYVEIFEARKKDIFILSEINENHPVLMQVFASPSNETKKAILNDGTSQFTAILQYKDILGVGDLDIQLCFSSGLEMPYPPFSSIIWNSIESENPNA